MDDIQGTSVEILQFVGIIKTGTDAGDDVKAMFQTEGKVLFSGFFGNHSEVFAKKVFHRDEIRVLDIPEIVNLDNILMLKQRCQLRFIDEGAQEFLFFGKMRKDLLEGHEFLEALDADDLGPV
jgi:hypothetical protein